MIASGGLSGGLSSSIAGGSFADGFRQGIITAGLNHAMHIITTALQNGKYAVVGIYGAGGENAGDNPRLRNLVEAQGGLMFTSLAGEGDSEIINHILNEYNNGKLIKIYGYSRGAVAAVRIANELQHKVAIIELNLYDPVILGGELRLEGSHVMRVNHFYQRNETDLARSSSKLEYAENPFKGSPLNYTKNKHGYNTKINSTDFTGVNYKNGRPVNHNNIIRHILGL